MNCFKNLTFKSSCTESLGKLLEEGYIKYILDSDNNQHIVLEKKVPFNNLSVEEKLYMYGVTTIPILSNGEIELFKQNFMNEMLNFPEYKRSLSDPTKTLDNNPLTYVLGGFGAFGNPSSFHNLIVRQLRLKAYHKCKKELFTTLIKSLNEAFSTEYKLEVLFDRFMYRLKNTSPTAEKWHRDVADDKFIDDFDEIYGGWINLDDTPQYLSCIPGSHLNIKLKELKHGFAMINKNDIHHFKPYKTLIEIPPGHCVIFPQYILHEVVSKKQSYDMMRLFTGWRLTRSSESLFTNSYLEEVIEKQASPLLPSGQKPSMYAANHASFFLKKEFMINPEKNYKANTKQWSVSTFNDLLLKKNGIVERFLKSLEDYGFTKYSKYSEKEKYIYFPHAI